jgi:hypothetical protein
MNKLRAGILLVVVASLAVQSAHGELSVTENYTFNGVVTPFYGPQRVNLEPFSPGYRMDLSFEGFAINRNSAPSPIDFEVRIQAGATEPLFRQVFSLPFADASAEPVAVPISLSFTNTLATRPDTFEMVFSAGVTDQIQYWGTIRQTGTVDAPVIKLPELVVEAGATQIEGLVTISGGSEQIAGLEFPLQVANGGPENDPPGDSIVPIAVTSMETEFPGSVFSTTDVYQFHPRRSNGSGLSEIFPGEFQIAQSQTIIDHGAPFASISGTDLPLVRFTLGLHDALPGTYPLIASKTRLGNTLLLDDSQDDARVKYLQVIDGSITILPRPDAIVPEPGTIVLAGMAAVSVTCLRGRSRNRPGAKR